MKLSPNQMPHPRDKICIKSPGNAPPILYWVGQGLTLIGALLTIQSASVLKVGVPCASRSLQRQTGL